MAKECPMCHESKYLTNGDEPKKTKCKGCGTQFFDKDKK